MHLVYEGFFIYCMLSSPGDKSATTACESQFVYIWMLTLGSAWYEIVTGI